MKILQIIQTPELRGAEIFACQLSEELKRMGHTVDVLYLFANKSFDLNFDLKFIPLNGNKKKRLYDFGAYRRMARIITAGKYDLVQANAADTLKYAVFSKVIFRWKTPLVYRNANTMTSLIDTRIKAIFNRFLLNRSQYIISVSENSKKDIVSFAPSIKDRCVAIPIGTYEFDKVNPIQEKSGRTVIVNTASFVREKNHLFLIRIFKRFTEIKPGAILWLVGDGPLRPRIETLIEALGLKDKVVLWSYRKDVISILKASDMVLMPSIIEGLPGAILEAFSCGIPVVASAVGGIPEVLIDGRTGYCIREMEEEAYLRAMVDLVDNPTTRASIVREAKELVSDHYLMPLIASRFDRKYLEIVQSN